MVKSEAKMTGGCLCGDVTYTISGTPVFVSQCCCKDCQKATGTGHTTIIGVDQDQLAITGSPGNYTTVGDTGGSVTRNFCVRCGGRIYTSGTLPGRIVMVQAGSLDDPEQVRPTSIIYFKDRIGWDQFDPTLPTFDGMRQSG